MHFLIRQMLQGGLFFGFLESHWGVKGPVMADDSQELLVKLPIDDEIIVGAGVHIFRESDELVEMAQEIIFIFVKVVYFVTLRLHIDFHKLCLNPPPEIVLKTK